MLQAFRASCFSCDILECAIIKTGSVEETRPQDCIRFFSALVYMLSKAKKKPIAIAFNCEEEGEGSQNENVNLVGCGFE